MAKEMTVEEAVRIIKESYEFGDKFDEAVAYLKEHDADNEVLVPFKDEKAQDMMTSILFIISIGFGTFGY